MAEQTKKREVTEDGLCWCGSGKPYETCHKAIDDEIKLHQLAGEEVPARSMIKSAAQIEGIRKACALNTAVLDEVAKYIRKGMTTEEIDQIVYQFTTKNGGIPAPLHFCGFPKSVCTSVNDQVCHGIPDKQVVLRSGDIVNVDVSTIVDGYYADASRMFEIGHVDKRARDLVANGRDVFGDYDEVSAAMERVLNPRRSADKLMEGLEYAAGRFDVDLELARADESRTWEALVDAVGSVPRNESWENEDGWIWYRGGMDGQRDLLTGDEKSADRIRYYRRELRQTLFDYAEHMPSPDALEVDYRVFFGKLVDTVPFAL